MTILQIASLIISLLVLSWGVFLIKNAGLSSKEILPGISLLLIGAIWIFSVGQDVGFGNASTIRGLCKNEVVSILYVSETKDDDDLFPVLLERADGKIMLYHLEQKPDIGYKKVSSAWYGSVSLVPFK